MDDNFPIPIFSDDDLTVYENYLNSLNVKPNNETFYELLKANVGKNIKIYIVFGNQLTAREGKLLNVFNDYIVLCKNREKLAIKLSEIKFISVI